MVLEDPLELTASKTEVRVMARGIEADRRARTAVWRRAGRMGRFCTFSC